MNDSELLPHILETLSKKPELCDTYENLCEEIAYVMSSENLKEPGTGNVQKALKNALDVGQNLGILTLTDDLIRMTFNMDKDPILKKASPKDAINAPADSEYFTMQPRRTHTVKPNLIPHGRSRRRRISRGRSRRGRRRRSRSRRR
ncbi:uncharacterized protein ACRADG_005029 [Cochliomyia hominivorax]